MPPAPQVYSEAPTLAAARVVLGVTLRLDAPLVWAQGLVSQVFRAFVARAPEGALRWYASSARDGWQGIDARDHERIATELDLPWHLGRLRHPVRVRVADQPGASEWLFHYRELDPARGGETSYLQLFTPHDGASGDLLEACLELANLGPFKHGVAGFHLSWNLRDPVTSAAAALPWCRRYAGLHFEDPDALASLTAKGLAAVNWVTLVGERFLEASTSLGATLDAGAWRGAVRAMRARHGRLVIAGEEPSLGDLNTLLFPDEYAEVATALSPWTLAEPPPFRAWPTKPDETLAWHRRLVDVEAWQAVAAG